MGYSCSARASMVQDALCECFKRMGSPTSNGVIFKSGDIGFFETGRESRDGSINGAVWMNCDIDRTPNPKGERCMKVGTFKFSPEGKVRMHGIDSKILRYAEKIGKEEYAKTWFPKTDGTAIRYPAL